MTKDTCVQNNASLTMRAGLRACYVYLMANRARTLYTGFTSNLPQRVHEHKQMLCDGFLAAT